MIQDIYTKNFIKSNAVSNTGNRYTTISKHHFKDNNSIIESFNLKSINVILFKKCEFNNINFKKLDLSGCIFETCSFIQCAFSKSTFNYNVFSNCEGLEQ
jgi:uncharacterized protein YjbI with pentapeptide repeats